MHNTGSKIIRVWRYVLCFPACRVPFLPNEKHANKGCIRIHQRYRKTNVSDHHRLCLALIWSRTYFVLLAYCSALSALERCIDLFAADAKMSAGKMLQLRGRHPRAGLRDVNLLLEGLKGVPEDDKNLLLAQVKQVHCMEIQLRPSRSEVITDCLCHMKRCGPKV